MRYRTNTERRAKVGRPRRGFTVVEVLVALVVVSVGLLGAAGMSATALRASNAALRERSAVARARTRVAVLQAAGCTFAADGTLRRDGTLVEQWSVGPVTGGVRLAEARSFFDGMTHRRIVLLRSAILC